MFSCHYFPIRQAHVIHNGLKRIRRLNRFIGLDRHPMLLQNNHSSKLTSLVYRFAQFLIRERIRHNDFIRYKYVRCRLLRISNERFIETHHVFS